MILSVSHSPKSVCTKFIAAKTTLINQQFADQRPVNASQ